MKRMKQQYKICLRDTALSEVLLHARNLSVEHCENEFRFERWNCSRRALILKRVLRETAFLHAIAASAISYSVAVACAKGALKNSCHCAVERERKFGGDKWRWGGCGDNFIYAKKITKRFLQLRLKGDTSHDILRHDSEVGIDAVAKNMKKVCRCQGVSGTCTFKVCWKRISQFKDIAHTLKLRYHEAEKLNLGNEAAKKRKKKKTSKDKLLYLAKSPTFCDRTAGRQCSDTGNCATLCCSRGYDVKPVMYSQFCQCRWQNGYKVKCDNCNYSKEEYYCRP